MADDTPGARFHSIADAATASWYAHRTSTPSSSSILKDGNQRQVSTTRAAEPPTPASALASAPATASASASTSASASASASPAPLPMPKIIPWPPRPEDLASAASAALSAAPSATPTPTSSRRESEGGQASGDIRSDITAWQSALQSLPPEFANAALPLHPLAQALANQPTLRPVEWNQYRQQGGFVPRTAHDYSSLMIFISGLVNPNPCRNCLLRNGPFARCVVSPPDVLSVSTLRHACANCTYQNQYKKCTNEPISEQEKARSEMARPVVRAKNPAHRPTIPRKPKTNNRTKRHERRLLEFQRRFQEQKHAERGNAPVTQPSVDTGSKEYATFDDKLKYIRARSPQGRQRMAAETLQWQAAIATVQAEELASANASANASTSRTSDGRTSISRAQAPLISQPLSQPISAVSRFAVPSFVESPAAGTSTITYEPMDEDESEGEQEVEQEDEYEGTPWVGSNHRGPMIKAPR
ncbi:hypothetical protein GGR51DRAFT_509831 [Nemania sp. FL0031]|nr:hypothetical protein GGR51DRAFT_509831 [Nemania sp. FL0031]